MLAMMEDQYVGRLTSHMQVCDDLGYKIGTIARVYRDEYASLELAGARSTTVEGRPALPGVIEVKTGMLGLGPHLYVPVTAIREATEDSVFLDKPKNDAIREFQHKPDYLADLQ
jgi:hypothetical protein